MGRIDKKEWVKMDTRALTGLLGNRLARIELLKAESEEIQRIIKQKTKG